MGLILPHVILFIFAYDSVNTQFRIYGHKYKSQQALECTETRQKQNMILTTQRQTIATVCVIYASREKAHLFITTKNYFLMS